MPHDALPCPPGPVSVSPSAAVTPHTLRPPRWRAASGRGQHGDQAGSQTMEYALLLVVAATVASLALAWARGGGIASLLDAMLAEVRSLMGVG